MSNREAESLLAYLTTHPSYADRLRRFLLGESECKQTSDDIWLSAREVGERCGMSPKWVKDRIPQLPPGTAEQRGSKRTWYVNYTRVQNQIERMKE